MDIIQDDQASAPVKSNRAGLRLLSTVFAIALAGVLLYFSLRGIEWGRVGQIFSHAKVPYVLLCCVIFSTALFIRAYRWRILLQAEGDVPVSLAFWATSAGYFGNNFLPARAGEVVRTLMISSRSSLSKAFVLTTALCERLADAIALVTISAIVLLIIPFRPGWLASAAKPFAFAGAAAIVALAILPYLDKVSKSVLNALPLPQAVSERMQHLIGHILRGIRSFHDVRRLGGFLSLTCVIWCMDVVTTLIGAKALGISISVPVAFLLIAGLGLGSALPSTPGYVGIYQFVAVSILTPFGISRTDAIAYILFFQALMYVAIGVWGLVALLKFRKPKKARSTAHRSVNMPASQEDFAVTNLP